MNDYDEKDVDVAVDLAVLKLRCDDLTQKVKDLEAEAKKITEMANRWKGGGAALIALGTVAGTIFSSFDKIKAFLFKLGG